MLYVINNILSIFNVSIKIKYDLSTKILLMQISTPLRLGKKFLDRVQSITNLFFYYMEHNTGDVPKKN